MALFYERLMDIKKYYDDGDLRFFKTKLEETRAVMQLRPDLSNVVEKDLLDKLLNLSYKIRHGGNHGSLHRKVEGS